MNSYFDKLQDKLNQYKTKYALRPRKAAMKMVAFNAKYAFSLSKTRKAKLQAQSQLPVSPIYPASFLRIAIAEGGGLGDSIFQTTYIKQIRKIFNKPIIIDFYCRNYKAFQNFPFIDNVFPYTDQHNIEKYDVYIVSRRFYIILKMDEKKTKSYSKQFYDFCIDCKHLTDNILSGEYQDNLFTQYALIMGKNRLEQANIHNLLNLDRTTEKYMQWSEKDMHILEDYNLENQDYITVCRAVDSKYGNNHPKLWLYEYYNILIEKIKKHYPHIKIVQIGSKSAINIIKHIDLNLVGKTTIEQSKIILKYSLLHIDGEGGLVHMKNFLNGKSVVMFGPTLPIVFGYDENINLRSEVCPYTCEWVTNKWTEGCIKGCHPAECMKALHPDLVFAKIKEYIDAHPKWKYTYYDNINIEETLSKGNLRVAQIYRSDNHFIHMACKYQNKVSIYDVDLSIPNNRNPKNTQYYAEALKKQIKAEYGYIYNIPAKDESFDVVYCDRINEARYPNYVIKEFLRILKNNGKLILLYPSDKNFTGQVRALNDKLEQDSEIVCIIKEKE